MARYIPMLFNNFNSLMNDHPWFFDGLNEDFRASTPVTAQTFNARMDFYRKSGKLFVEAELPGIKPEDVDLHVYADHLTLAAEKAYENKDNSDGRNYLKIERSWGKVERMIPFPVEADPDTAKASFKNGVLTIEIAEKPEGKAHKKVEITVPAAD